VHISALRKKLGDDAKKPRYIRTFRSAGYMLAHPEAP
jgi:DNA-binding response OmpR family regulator